MMKATENSETLSQAILSEAQAEVETILAGARAKADGILQQAQEKAAAERKAILERGAQEAARLRGQAVATAQLKARALELEHREKLLNEVFDAARGRLPAITAAPTYPQLAGRLLAEAVSALKVSQVKIHTDPLTAAVLTPEVLEALSRDLQVEIVVGEPLAQNTGVVVESSDGHMNFDNTLENRLSRLQGTLRFPVYQLLVGESQ